MWGYDRGRIRHKVGMTLKERNIEESIYINTVTKANDVQNSLQGFVLLFCELMDYLKVHFVLRLSPPLRIQRFSLADYAISEYNNNITNTIRQL